MQALRVGGKAHILAGQGMEIEPFHPGGKKTAAPVVPRLADLASREKLETLQQFESVVAEGVAHPLGRIDEDDALFSPAFQQIEDAGFLAHVEHRVGQGLGRRGENVLRLEQDHLETGPLTDFFGGFFQDGRIVAFPVGGMLCFSENGPTSAWIQRHLVAGVFRSMRPGWSELFQPARTGRPAK